MTPLNERIARLLEPVPKARGEHSDGGGYSFVTEGGCYVRYSPDSTPVLLSSFDPEHSLDVSMRVIEAKWPKCHVSLFWSDKRQEYVARISDIRTEAEDREIGDGEGADRAEALALALCAALAAQGGGT